MKKLFLALTLGAIATACSDVEELDSTSKFIVTCYNETDNGSRTAFDTPNAKTIPFLWSTGDYIWLANTKSDAITEDCQIANFVFSNGQPAYVVNGHVFYNLTGENECAHVLATQSADGNLGNDGDFGYATLDKYNSFFLKHKTSYLWFDTTTEDEDMPMLKSITLDADGVNIAGKQTYDFANDQWNATVTEGSSSITLDFANGHELLSLNEGVMAAMVCLPAAVNGKTLTITYTFDDGSTFTETKNPTKNFVSGATLRIKTTIAKTDLVKEPSYELRVLTFEDEDTKFESYYLEYADGWSGREIFKWSDLIDDPQYMGPLTYGNDQMDAMYYWYDGGNTELYHMFPDNYAYCFWGGGHAVSNYWGAGYTDDDRNTHIAKYYGQEYVDQWAGQLGADAFLGWFNVQMMIPIAPHSGNNFAIHYGYKDDMSYIENLPELSFYDCEPRVIDHMYVTNTNYTLNQLYNGVKSEEGNSFGGDWSGLTEDAWLKIVAQGFESVDDDEPTAEVEFYLVNGYNVVTDWQKWDLSGLGKVAKVRFNFLYSEEMGGKYGFTIPGYFAYDDIAVRFEK